MTDTTGVALSDRLVVGLTWRGEARVLVVDATATARSMAERHGLTGEAAQLAAELTVATVLLGAWIKGDERVSVQVQGEAVAPGGTLAYFGEVDAEGAFRGRMTPSDHRGLEPRGLMLVLKADGTREMYRGVSSLEGERVGAALERHLRTSDQVAAMVRIESVPGGPAIGLLVERLPGDGGTVTRTAAEFDRDVAPLRSGDVMDLVVDIAFGKVGGSRLDVLDIRPLAFRCRCSDARVDTMLVGLGPTELEDMIVQDGGAEVRCHFCGEVRRRDVAALQRLLSGLRADS